MLPSRELTYPTKREKENHRLKYTLGGGYVSSQEGRFRGSIPGLPPLK